MYLFLLLPLLASLMAFMLTPLSTVQDYLPFFDICFAGYAVMGLMAFFMHHGEKHYRKTYKEVMLHRIMMNFCVVFRLVFMTCAVFFLMTSTIISVIHITTPIVQTLCSVVYGVAVMVTGARFIYELCNFDRAIHEDLGW